jgi:hypothetical protein
MDKIAAAFIKAKKDFGPVLKGKNNPAFKSKYANLEACLDAVDDACLAHGIALYQETFEDSTGVTVETVFLHESGESLRCGKLHVPAAKNDPQGYGSALTYARRYSILTACGIAAEDDDGNAASRPAPPQADTRQRERREPATHQDETRRLWLAETTSNINAAKSVGDLKRIVDEAIRIATEENDADMVKQIQAAADAKAATAKARAAA